MCGTCAVQQSSCSHGLVPGYATRMSFLARSAYGDSLLTFAALHLAWQIRTPSAHPLYSDTCVGLNMTDKGGLARAQQQKARYQVGSWPSSMLEC